MVKYLALGGAKVYIASRSEARVKSAMDELLAENPKISKAQLEYVILDLGDLKSVLSAAYQIKQKEQKIDILSLSPVT